MLFQCHVVEKIFQNLRGRLKFTIRQAMKIKLFVGREIQSFELGIFSFNSYFCYLIRGFIASTRAFNPAPPTRAFSHATRDFNLATRAFSLATRALSLLTRLLKRELGLVTCGFELATREFQLVTRGFELATRGFELVTRVLLFHCSRMCYIYLDISSYEKYL